MNLKNRMRRLFSITLLVIVLSSCASIKNGNDLVGDWRIFHVFYGENEEEILSNEFEENGWNVGFHKTKSFYIIDERNTINIYLDRHGDPITGRFKYVKKDSVKFKMYDLTDTRFNGLYSINMVKDTIKEEGIRILYSYLKLESDKMTILALKSEALDKIKLF